MGATDASAGGRRSALLMTAGLVSLAALALGLLVLSRLVPLDVLVWSSILTRRGCWTDDAVDIAVSLATQGIVVELVAAVVIALRTRGVSAVWPSLAMCGVGLLASKTLKNVFVRERPSMLPGVALGHSFPSGHVMNTTVAVLAIVTLTADFRHPRRWRIAALAFLAVVVLGRLMLARHWVTDVAGAVLAAVAVAGLTTGLFARRPLVAPAAVALVLLAALGAVVNDRARAISLPSALSIRDAHTVEVRVGFPEDAKAWRDRITIANDGDAKVAWVDGTGTVELDVPATFDAGPGGRRAPDVMLAVAGRPDIATRCCVTVRLELNGHALPPFVAFVGWREYRFLLPPTAVRLGKNELRITVENERGAPWRFAAAYVRLDAT